MAKPAMPPGRELQLSNLAWVEDGGPVRIDWQEVEYRATRSYYEAYVRGDDNYPFRDRHIIARMLIAARDGTWVPMEG